MTAKILSEFYPVSKSAVHKWIKKFEERLLIVTEKKLREVVAIDETVRLMEKNAKSNELILMRVYPSRNYI